MANLVFPLPNNEYLVAGSASVKLSSGAGSLTVSEVSTIDAILYLDAQNSSSSAYTLVKATGNPSSNSVPVEVLDGTVGGTAANPTLSSASSATVYFAVIGH